MTERADKNLALIEHELRFIARESQQIESSYDIVDEINYAVVSALRALAEHKVSLRQERAELPKGAVLAA